jgi:hypothetical protein
LLKKQIYRWIFETPVSFNDIIAYGHGDKKYAHYEPDLYLADSNCTIRSIIRLMCDLEHPPKYSIPESLFTSIGMTDFYAAVLSGCEAFNPGPVG